MAQLKRLIPIVLFLGAACALAQEKRCLPDPEPPDTHEPDPRVRLVRPATGDIFYPGQTIELIVDLAPSLTAVTRVGATLTDLAQLSAKRVSGRRFAAQIRVPASLSGPLTIRPDFTDKSGRVIDGAAVVVGVKRREAPASIRLADRDLYAGKLGASKRMRLTGTYADGTKLDLTSCALGTTYTTSNPSVVTVSSDGQIETIGLGIATVTAKHGPLVDYLSFVFEDGRKTLPPPIDLTQRVAISKSEFQFDPKSGLYLQSLTITNTSAEVLPPFLHLVFAGLSEPVELTNRSGLTKVLSPLGRPYLTLNPLPGEMAFRPGASMVVTLRFASPDAKAINYSVGLYRLSPMLAKPGEVSGQA